jgi:hypothetical protein
VKPRGEAGTTRLEGWPALSRAGNRFWFFGIAWVVLGPVVLAMVSRALDVPNGEAPSLFRAITTLLSILVVLGPVVIAYFPRRFARLRPLRWLLAAPQPGASLDATGIELCTPEDGCRRYAWEEIASLEPDPAWLRGSFVEGWPIVDLKGSDGRVLYRVPASVYGELHPIGSKWHSGPRTLAEHIVVRRPDRFAFLEPTHRPPHYWFRLAQDGAPRPSGPRA